MMYPRLMLARNLLRDDGLVCISMGDSEVSHLRLLCDAIFGDENFVAQFVWKRRSSSGLAEKLISTDHEYVVAYQRASFNSAGKSKDYAAYNNPDNDPRGPWRADNLTVGMNRDQRPNQFYELVDPLTGIKYAGNPNRVWAYIRESMARLIAEGRIIFPSDNTRRPMLKRFRDELKITTNPFSTWLSDVGLNSEGTRVLQDLMQENINIYPKPRSLIAELLKIATTDGDLVLDFFAGSGTTGDVTLHANSTDGGNRKFILVQLPESLVHKSYKSIADITRERLRRTGKEIKLINSDYAGDLGFRVFKLDTTSVRPWDTNLPVNDQRLLDETDNILPARSEQDLLYELLLKRGIELTAPYPHQRARRQAGLLGRWRHAHHLPLPPSIVSKDVEALAGGIVDWYKQLKPQPAEVTVADRKAKPTKVEPPLIVFRDQAFDSDVSKSNLTEILKQRGFSDVRSL